MAENYNFSPKTVATEVQKKLAIKKMPQWAQNIEQIQQFFDDSIQYWFTPEQRKSLDGYIGDRSSQAAYNKVFINEVSKEREYYQLVPSMVSMDDQENILSKLTYQDLIDNLGHYGSEEENQSRLLTARYYSWSPAINPDMIINFSNYYWDTQNVSNLNDTDYIVSQRGAIDGNAWSRFNYWYHINETDANGDLIITPAELESGRFVSASRPIIQYTRNIELLNHGRVYRGDVNILCDTIEPEDIMLRPTSDNIIIDGVFLRNGMKVLFTNIINTGENNRVYRVVTNVVNGVELYSLTLDPDFTDSEHPTGAPVTGDSFYVLQGTVYGTKTVHWDASNWTLSQNKEARNQYPQFNLYDYNFTSLSDDVVYPESTFAGSSLFEYQVSPTASYDSTLGLRVSRDSYQQFIFNNTISNTSYYYRNNGILTEQTNTRFFRIINDAYVPASDTLRTDWELAENSSKQYVKQTFRPEVQYELDANGEVDPAKPFYKSSYELAMSPDEVDGSFDVRVEQSGFLLDPEFYNVSTVNNVPTIELLVDDFTILDEDLFSIETYSRFMTPNTNIGAYEVPLNLASNAKNEPVTEIAISGFFNHFVDIIEHQEGFSGNPNGVNNFWETPQDMSKGRLIIQNEGSLLPLMIHNVDENINLVDAAIYVQTEYNRFKNKFKNTLEMMDRASQLTRVNNSGETVLIDTAENLVRDIISRINVGKNTDMPFAYSGMASTTELNNTYIPATPQYLGMLPTFEPSIRVRMSFDGKNTRYYNIAHTGAYSLSFNQDTNDDSENANRRDIIFLALETMIYNSINANFTNSAYIPRLSEFDVKPSANRLTDYSPYVSSMGDQVNEWDNFANIGFANWAANNHVTLGSPSVTEDWRSWNWSTTNYTFYKGRNGETLKARGNWRGIYLDHFDTVNPNTRPWEMLGFTQKPAWWDNEYTSETINGITFYSDDNLWGPQGDLVTGTVRLGDRAGVDTRFARSYLVMPFNETTGELLSPADDKLKLVDAAPETDLDKGLPWKFSDVSPNEYSYMNSNLASFDTALSVYRARPAEWSNYFWNSVEFTTFNFDGDIQWMKRDGSDRIILDSNELVHGEANNEVVGYQQWVSDNLRKDHKNVTTYYGDVVRSVDVRLAYRLGGFGKLENLTFVSDSFGLVSQENQHLTLNKSSVRRQETLSGVSITWDGSGYIVNGYDSLTSQFNYLTPVKTGKKSSFTSNNKSFIKYLTWNSDSSILKYNTRLKSRQDVVDFLIGYGMYLEAQGWIFEDIQTNGSVFNWETISNDFLDWSFTAPIIGDLISLSPAAKTAKFGSVFGAIDSVTQYSGGTWALLDDNSDGIYPYEIDTTRIGNVMTVRVDQDSDKRMMLLRLNIREFEHTIIFDNKTIFNDIMYSTQYGLYQDKLRVVGVITDGWNGRLEAPGFMVTDDNTLPGFEKLVDDFRHYYDNEDPTSSVQLNNLARHMIGFQTRDYLSELILNPKNQVNFYKGFVKEKGTFQSFDKILRTSKTLSTNNYRTLEEWAIKVGDYGKLGGNQKLQFIVREDELKQNPQIIAFNSADTYESDKDDTITYYGTRGLDDRWITRSSDNQEFPMVSNEYFTVDMPSAGPVTLNDADFITEDLTVISERRKAWESNNSSEAQSAWVLKDNFNNWELYSIDRFLDIQLIGIESIQLSETDTTQVASKLIFSHDHNLRSGQLFYVQGDTTPVTLTNERFFTQIEDTYDGEKWNPTVEYNEIDPNTSAATIIKHQNRTYQAKISDPAGIIPVGEEPGTDTGSEFWEDIVVTREITVNAVLTPTTFSTDSPTLVSYRVDYGSYGERNTFIEDRTVPVVNTKAFNRPVIYNQSTNKTETYLNVWDPLRGIVPGVASSEVSYTMQTDPALYNSNDSTSAAWGKDHVGKVWWDTSAALYLDYTQPVRNNDNSENEILTRKYRRENWGKLLPGSEIILKEWVRSPVQPGEWDNYVASQAPLDKDAGGYVPSGTADVNNWSAFSEYDTSTGVTKTYYYFWVQDAIYVPRVNGRTKPISELERIIEDPTAEGLPWFAPIGNNEFICSGFQDIITNNESVLQITYSENPDLEINDHKEWELFQERDDYNFNETLWARLLSSLVGQEIIGGITYPLVYPQSELGTMERETWFVDMLSARRELIDSANGYYKTQNITNNGTLMNNVFNYADTPRLINSVDFNVVDVDGNLVLDVDTPEVYVENQSVLLSSTGDLPSPLETTLTYFVHVRDDGYYQLKTIPTQDSQGTIIINDQGTGVHSLVKSEDINKVTSDYLVMADFWDLDDWYAEGFSDITPFIDITNFDQIPDTDAGENVYRIFDNVNLWTLYRRNFTRDVPYLETVGRQNGTVQLNDKLIEEHEMYNDDGTVTDAEQVIIDAIRLLAETFDGAQSKIVFDMLYYVHQEQPVLDWVFKTSYIYVFGIEQVLSDRYTVNLDQVDYVIEYFKEAKPYRTKIRSAVEQKTSDTDTIIGDLIEGDPSPIDQSLYENAIDEKADGEYTGTQARLRFRQQMMQMYFDRIGCEITADASRAEDYAEAFKKYSATSSVMLTENAEIIEDGNPFNISDESLVKPSTTDLNSFYTTMFEFLRVEINKVSSVNINETVWSNELPNFTTVSSSVTYIVDHKFVNVCVDTWEVEREIAEKILAISYQELSDLVQYFSQANRFYLDDTSLTQEQIDGIMDCEFQGTTVNGTPQTRLPLGYSGNSDDDEIGYISYGTALYDHMLSQGVSPEKLEEYGFLNVNDGKTFIADSLNDKSYNPLNPLINDSGELLSVVDYTSTTSTTEQYFDDQNAYGNAGYEENIISYDTVSSHNQYMFDISDMRDYHSANATKFVTFSGLPAPALPGVVDFGKDDGSLLSPYVYVNDIANADGILAPSRGLWLYDNTLGDVPWNYVYVGSTNYPDVTLTQTQTSWIRYRNRSFNAEDFYTTFNVYFESIDRNGDGISDYSVIDYGYYCEFTGFEFSESEVYGTDSYVSYKDNDLSISRVYRNDSIESVGPGEFDPNDWTLIPIWNNITQYVVGSVVDVDGIAYRCITDHVTSEGFNQLYWETVLSSSEVPADDISKFNFDFGTSYGDPQTDFGTLEVQGFIMNHPHRQDEVIVSVPDNIKEIAESWADHNVVNPDHFIHRFKVRDTNTENIIVDSESNLEVGDTVILTSADPDRDPWDVNEGYARPLCNDPDEVYTVSFRDNEVVNLIDSSGMPVQFVENPDFPYTIYTDIDGNMFLDANFTMVKINPAPLGSTVSITNMNYDSFYGRYLTPNKGFSAVSSNGTFITVADHGFNDLDTVKFNTYKIGADLGGIDITSQYYVRVRSSDTFEVFSTISDAVSNTNVILPGSDIDICTVTKVGYWYVGTVTAEQVNRASIPDETSLYDDVEYQEISLGFARPGISSGSTEELVQLQMSEQISITVFQDDRVYSIGNPNVDNVYSSGAELGKTFVFRLDKGSDEVSWNIRNIQNANSGRLNEKMWYNDSSFSTPGVIETGSDNVYDVGTEYIKVYGGVTPSIPHELFDVVLEGTGGVPEYINYTVGFTGNASNQADPTFEDIPILYDIEFTTFSIDGVQLVEGVGEDYIVQGTNLMRLYKRIGSSGVIDCQYREQSEIVSIPFPIEDSTLTVNGETLVPGVNYSTIDSNTIKLLELYEPNTVLYGEYVNSNTVYMFDNIRRGEHGSAEGGLYKEAKVIDKDGNLIPLDLSYHNSGVPVIGLFDIFDENLTVSFDTDDSEFEYSTVCLYDMQYLPYDAIPGDYAWTFVSIQESRESFARTLKEELGSAGTNIHKMP
ncbi:hypothetical protein NVP2275O_424 [Vibrio phage 2.275.O._10N.286.54.E11]|nr:hypothetical protein NVP2275O_424 [Vibrio phage 2.275.O._10N.286.54.E11]